MFFLVSKLFSLFFAPSHVLALLILGAALLLAAGWRRAGRAFAVLAALLLLGIGVLPSYILLARPLENEFPRPTFPAHVDGVLVLGGGIVPEILATRNVPATEIGESRMAAATELARRYPNAKILYSGGSGQIGGSVMPEAAAARYIFAQMGLDPARLTLEDKSRTTRENIAFAKAIARPQPGQTWLLATSALQMPRAMQVAAQLKWPMLPWPTDYLTTPQGFAGVMDIPGNLSGFDWAFHEWLGARVYRWRR